MGIVDATSGRLKRIVSQKRAGLRDLPSVSFVGPSTVEELNPELGDPSALQRAETLFARVKNVAQQYFPKRVLLFGLSLAAWQLVLATLGALGNEPSPFIIENMIVLLIPTVIVLFRLNLRSSIEQALLTGARGRSGKIGKPSDRTCEPVRAFLVLPGQQEQVWSS
jgi:hypothetical protein